jgi:hypothetical protein
VCTCTACVEQQPRFSLGKRAESHLTYIAVAIRRSCFAALTAATALS